MGAHFQFTLAAGMPVQVSDAGSECDRTQFYVYLGYFPIISQRLLDKEKYFTYR
jgi:hypothetical protein